MKVLNAKVMDGGRLDVPEGSLHAGEVVTLLVPEADEGFELYAGLPKPEKGSLRTSRIRATIL